MLTLHVIFYAQKYAFKVDSKDTIKRFFIMICVNFSLFLGKPFSSKETGDESLISIYITAAMYSILFDRKHKSISAPERTDRKSDTLV